MLRVIADSLEPPKQSSSRQSRVAFTYVVTAAWTCWWLREARQHRWRLRMRDLRVSVKHHIVKCTHRVLRQLVISLVLRRSRTPHGLRVSGNCTLRACIWQRSLLQARGLCSHKVLLPEARGWPWGMQTPTVLFFSHSRRSPDLWLKEAAKVVLFLTSSIRTTWIQHGQCDSLQCMGPSAMQSDCHQRLRSDFPSEIVWDRAPAFICSTISLYFFFHWASGSGLLVLDAIT